MPVRAPYWWYGSGFSLIPALLEPAALIWRLIGWLRWRAVTPYRSKLPVVCIGNLVAGGAGKTPTAIAIAEMLKSAGETPVFLTRGYGGSITGPHLVDAAKDGSAEVGDEALLLAKSAATIVSPDRARGARFAETLDCSVIVMDDGFQNPYLAKDFSLVVVDRASGVGNGMIIPAGPLRGSLSNQLSRAGAVLLVGHGGAGDEVADKARQHSLPVFNATVRPAEKTAWLKNKRLVAFAGIAHPEKFFRTLEDAGAKLPARIEFPDHHDYSQQDAARLLAAAAQAKASLVTTEKDWARLAYKDAALEELRKNTRALPVKLAFQDKPAIAALVKDALISRSVEQSLV